MVVTSSAGPTVPALFTLKQVSDMTGMSLKSLRHRADRGTLETITIKPGGGRGVQRFVALDTLKQVGLWEAILTRAQIQKAFKGKPDEQE